jgi:hypothetical protein
VSWLALPGLSVRHAAAALTYLALMLAALPCVVRELARQSCGHCHRRA